MQGHSTILLHHAFDGNGLAYELGRFSHGVPGKKLSCFHGAAHGVTQVICIVSVSLTVGVPVAVNVAPVVDRLEVANEVSSGFVPPKSVAVHDMGATRSTVGKVYVIVGDAPCPVPLFVIVNEIGKSPPTGTVTAAVLPHPALRTNFAAVTRVLLAELASPKAAAPVNELPLVGQVFPPMSKNLSPAAML